MSKGGAASDRGVPTALDLIADALACMGGESSPRAAYCDTQARAARAALLTVASGPDSRRAGGSEARDDRQRLVPSGRDAGAFLADAERVVSQLPAHMRNHIAVCAAMAYLRRARRALVVP